MSLPREHYRRIGEKGGRAGKYSLAKAESARNAARIRWLRFRQNKASTAALKNTGTLSGHLGPKP